MTKYLISFPNRAMVLTDEEYPIVTAEAHAVIEEAKAAGVYVFGGGIEEEVDPVLVSADGSVTADSARCQFRTCAARADLLRPKALNTAESASRAGPLAAPYEEGSAWAVGVDVHRAADDVVHRLVQPDRAGIRGDDVQEGALATPPDAGGDQFHE